jgi:hypothetical protein
LIAAWAVLFFFFTSRARAEGEFNGRNYDLRMNELHQRPKRPAIPSDIVSNHSLRPRKVVGSDFSARMGLARSTLVTPKQLYLF